MTSEGWLYLAVIIDLYSRAVIGWSMDSRMTAALTCDAFEDGPIQKGERTIILNIGLEKKVRVGL